MTAVHAQSNSARNQTGSIAFVQEANQFISFVVDDRHYCVDIMSVCEIKQWVGATPLPNAALHMRGVINLRGAIIPVIDLKALFGGGRTEATPLHVVVIVATAGGQKGLLVDAVTDIVTAGQGDVAAMPESFVEDRDRFFSGIVKTEEALVAIVDLGQLSTRPVEAFSVSAVA